MNSQSIAVFILIGLAVAFAVLFFLKKAKGFSKDKGCEADCGCGSSSEKVG